MKFSQFLNESPLPNEWDKSLYKGRLDFKKMIEYATSKSMKLGAGSSRVAFVIKHDSKESVIKIAKNPKGVSQNVQEIKYLTDKNITDLGIFIPIIDWDKENHKARWIQTELASKITDDYFERKTGLKLKELVSYVYRDVHQNSKNPYQQEEWSHAVKEDAFLTLALRKLFKENKDIEYGDLTRIENWGLYKGGAVIIDVGLDSTSIKMYQLAK